MSKHPDETTFLKESIIHNRSRIDMFMANEMFGDDLEPISEEGRGDEITNMATQTSTKRKIDKNFDEVNKDFLRKSKKSSKQNVDAELDPYESRTYQQIMIDIHKIKSLKEAYPEEYKEKLETNQDLLQKSLKSLRKEMNEIKKENVQLKDMIELYRNNYEKVIHSLEKYKRIEKIEKINKDKENKVFELELSEDIPSNNCKESAKQEIEEEFEVIRNQTRRSNIVTTFKRVDSALNKFGKKNEASKMFHDLSSIVVNPDDLPKDIKGFVMDTHDEGYDNDVIPNSLSKRSQVSKNIELKASKAHDSLESSRRNQL